MRRKRDEAARNVLVGCNLNLAGEGDQRPIPAYRTHSKNCGDIRTVSTRPAATSISVESGRCANARTNSRYRPGGRPPKTKPPTLSAIADACGELGASPGVAARIRWCGRAPPESASVLTTP